MKNYSVAKPYTLEQNLPTIPSKYQRIVKEAPYQNKSSPKLSKSYIQAINLARVRNNSLQQIKDRDDNSSTLSLGSNKHASNFNDTSSTEFSKAANSEFEYRDVGNRTKNAIEKYASKLNKRFAFGSSIKRFDSSQDLKKVFNRDPGPGSYLESDKSRERILKNDSSISSRNYNASTSYNQSYSAEKSQFDKKTISPGFMSKDSRFKEDALVKEQGYKPGPGAYSHTNTLSK